MKIRIILWLIVLACCAALGLWQKDNLSIFWREYRSIWLDYEDKGGWPTFRYQAIPDSIAKSDPEAAAIAETILTHPEKDERLFALSKGLLKFPQNDYFLSILPFYLSEKKGIDPDIRVRMGEQFVKSHQSNFNSHYFLADALLADRNNNGISEVLDQIAQGNECPNHEPMYEKYHKRISDLAGKAGISRMQVSVLNNALMEDGPYGLDKQLINFANAVFTDGDNNSGIRICDAIYAMQRKVLLAGNPREIALNNLSLRASSLSFGNWRFPESLELQRARITEERAKLDRFRLCARFPEKFLSGETENFKSPPSEVRDERKIQSSSMAIMMATHFGRMIVSLGIVILILGLLFLIDGYSRNEKVGIIKIIMFAFACFAFFISANIIYLLSAHGDPCSDISYTMILRMPKFDFDTFRDEPLILISIIIPIALLLLLEISRKGKWWLRTLYSILVTAGFLGFFAKSGRFNYVDFFSIGLFLPLTIIIFILTVITLLARWLSKWRIVWLLTEAILFGVLSILAAGYFYLEFIVMALFIIIAAVTIAGPAPKEKSPIVSLFTLSAKNSQQISIRTKCLKLISLFIVIYWILFVYQMPGSVYRINYEVSNYSPPVRQNYTLPEPNESTYRLILNRFENKKMMRAEAFKFVGLIMPEDLPDILNKFKELPSYDLDYSQLRVRPPWMNDPNKLEQYNKAHEPNILNDGFITHAIMCAGRDVVKILTEALIEPNNPRTLVVRAELGDETAKQPLEELLALNIERGNDTPHFEGADRLTKPAISADIIPALACVSEPNEAAERYIKYIQRRSIPEILQENELISKIRYLPKQQAKIVIKSYLKKVNDWIPSPKQEYCPSPYMTLIPLRSLVEIYGDMEIAEDVFRLMQLVAETGEDFEILDVSPYFTIESADLLKKGLDCRDDRFRAWSVWQLRKVGYKFSEEEIDKMIKDKSWMVRANTVVAEPKTAGKLAEGDKNSFVRYVASLYKDKS